MNVTNRYTREHNERVHSHEIAQSLLQPVLEGQVSASSLDPAPKLDKVEQRAPQSLQALAGNTFRNLEYKGLLRSKDLDLIQKNYPAYKEAEQKSNVNWRVLAAIHYRETHLSQHPATRGNPFQFDGSNKSKITGNLFKDATTAGSILQQKNQLHSTRYGLGPESPLQASQTDGENLEQAIFRYNGPIYGKPDRSPYVMNGYDAEHQNMPIYRGKAVNPHWGVDHQPGVMTLVRELKEAFPATSP